MPKEKICGIYCIENIINNKKYIGQGEIVAERWVNHRCSLRNNRHSNVHLQNAWNQYGEENFQFYILEVCESEILDNREKYFISLYQSKNRLFGYNMTDGGLGVVGIEFTIKEIQRRVIEKRNRVVTDITRQRMRDAQIGKTLSEETKKKISMAQRGISPANKGVPMSDEQKEKWRSTVAKRTKEDNKRISLNMSLSHIGKKRTKETREKMSESQKRCQTEERKELQAFCMSGVKRNQNTSSKYVGVHFNNINKNWRSRICINRKTIHLGCFDLESDAAKAYDKESWKLYGTLKKLNFPEDYMDMT